VFSDSVSGLKRRFDLKLIKESVWMEIKIYYGLTYLLVITIFHLELKLIFY
jgi:hypothetical protein